MISIKNIEQLVQRFNLLEDKADDEVIDASIRSGIELKGANLWVLMFAILVASIGLNVNSTAVVIGAMLISPLMGPIMGVGYGVGVYDTELIQRSLRNLGVATLISLCVSTFYFSLTPLSDAQSELLSRTTPSLWDVLIAFFGGLAGIIGTTRAEKNNVIPGVAIATALMPPLCTAGYGLSQLNAQFFFGAFYLYAINCVFIAFSTILIVWILHTKHKQFVDKALEKKVKNTLAVVVAITVIPSLYLATILVKKEIYINQAKSFISQQFYFPGTGIATQKIDASKRKIELTLVGEVIKPSVLAMISKRLEKHGLENTDLVVYQAKEQALDITTLKNNISDELYNKSLRTIEKQEQAIVALKQELESNIEQQQQAQAQIHWDAIAAELTVQYPQIEEAVLSQGQRWVQAQGISDESIILLSIKAHPKLKKDELAKIEAWLKVRTEQPTVMVLAQ